MRMLFIHHSVGRYLLRDGELRRLLRDRCPTIELWDHDYNEHGLSDAEGQRVKGGEFPVPDDNTDPEGLVHLLQEFAPGASLAERAGDFDAFLLKSCFPNSNIRSKADLERLFETYESLTEACAKLSQRVVVISTPPLVIERTTPANAARAQELNAELVRLLPDRGVPVIDIYSVLTSGLSVSGTLSFKYRKPLPFDSHLNHAGSRVAAEVVADTCARLFA